MQSVLAQAQKMQRELQKKQEEFYAKEFEMDYKGSITVNVMGDGTIKSIKINEALIDPEDPITLQEMVVEAINAAVADVKQQLEDITSSLMPAGMGGLGGLF